MIEDQTKINSRDCIKFKEANDEFKNYVSIINDLGCYSAVGKLVGNKSQIMSLDSYCLNKETVAHEFIHALDKFAHVSGFPKLSYI